MKIVAIIQARMQSRRLPGKVLKDIVGKPLLQHVITRARATRMCDNVIVATSTALADDPIVSFCESQGCLCFRGSENDVLTRYADAACFIGADTIVRFTADCPFLDPAVSRSVIEKFCNGRFDFVSNTLKRTYPDGLDTEVFSFEVLERAEREARLEFEREHVTPYLFHHPELFRLGNVAQNEDMSAYRWTVDEESDLEFARAVHEYFIGREDFSLTDVVKVLRKHPELQKINANVKGNPDPATLSTYARG